MPIDPSLFQKSLDRALVKYKEEKDKPLFPAPGDWHSKNGLMVFGEEISKAFFSDSFLFKKLRGVAKAIGLALCYGGTEYAVSRKVPDLTLAQAKNRVDTFFANLPSLKRYLFNLLKSARYTKLVKDLFGRIRYLPALGLNPYDEKNRRIIAYCERLVYNAPVQTSGSDQLKLIMCKQGSYLEKGRLNRFQGNLIVKYKPYTRIATIKETDVTDSFRQAVEDLPDGNVKVLILRGEDPVEEYDRPVQATGKFVRDHGMSIYW